MATDLHTLLKTKKVDNQFAQYFLYQIMVSIPDPPLYPIQMTYVVLSEVSNTSTQPVSSTATSNQATSSSTRTAISKSATLAWPACKNRR